MLPSPPHSDTADSTAGLHIKELPFRASASLDPPTSTPLETPIGTPDVELKYIGSGNILNALPSLPATAEPALDIPSLPVTPALPKSYRRTQILQVSVICWSFFTLGWVDGRCRFPSSSAPCD
jgi:hypothetical protein